MLESLPHQPIEVSNQPSASSEGHVPSGISLLVKKTMNRFWRELCRWIGPWPTAYGFVREFRSFFHRIRSLRTLYRDGLAVGPLVETHESEGPRLCDRTRARMLDMQKLEQTLPWISMTDLQVFLHGWEQGADWASRGKGSRS